MKPIRLTITKFRSFQTTQVFTFPDGPGLYFMGGVNEVEPRLGSNGAGKSTIWDALTWCLFEKTPSGLKAGDICHWDVEGGTKVEWVLKAASGEEIYVTRTWKPNTWTMAGTWDPAVIDLTKAKENPILQELRLQYQTFLQSVLTAQGQDMFLDLKHDRQAALFSEVMGLDYWLEASAKASKKASAQDDVSRKLESELSGAKGKLEGLRDFADDLQTFERKRKDRLAEVERKYQELLDHLKHHDKEAANLKADEHAALVAFKASRDALEASKVLLPPAADEVLILEEKIKDIDRQVSREGELEKFLKTHEHCPTCDQSISVKTQKAKVDKIMQSIRNLKWKRLQLIESKLEPAKIELRGIEDLIAINNQQHQENTDTLRRAEQAIKDGRRLNDLLERDLDKLEDEAERIAAEVNPYRAKQAAASTQHDVVNEVQSRLDESHYKYSLYSYWVRGFKELRLQLIAEALTELEVEVNSCVTELGLVGWELMFEVDRETKGGSIQRGFSVRVTSPHNSRAVPWEAWSGGEGQRLRLAANMGLANLIRSRTGADLPLEVWDEPSQGLSPQGVQDMLEALEHRAIKEQRQIWVVDHTAHSFGGYAGGATITKRKSGSTIEQY